MNKLPKIFLQDIDPASNDACVILLTERLWLTIHSYSVYKFNLAHSTTKYANFESCVRSIDINSWSKGINTLSLRYENRLNLNTTASQSYNFFSPTPFPKLG